MSTLRRYSRMKPSSGTRIPEAMRRRVVARDRYRCIPAALGIEHDCSPGRELDHVAASGALSRKSVTCDCNLVTMCPRAHRIKTEHGRDVRPVLIDYLADFGYGPHVEGHIAADDCGHVDPSPSCDGPCQGRVPA